MKKGLKMNNLDLKKVYDLQNPPFNKCPLCSCEIFYKKESCYNKYNFYFSYTNNDDICNSHLVDSLKFNDIGKFIYCAKCDKKLFKYRE